MSDEIDPKDLELIRKIEADLRAAHYIVDKIREKQYHYMIDRVCSEIKAALESVEWIK